MRNTHFSYLFRKPRYPVICDINGFLICGYGGNELFNNLKGRLTSAENEYDLFDVSGVRWKVYEKGLIISPFVYKRRWTKINLIELFNSSENSKLISQKYSTKSLSSKKLQKIFMDIMRLIEKSLI